MKMLLFRFLQNSRMYFLGHSYEDVNNTSTIIIIMTITIVDFVVDHVHGIRGA